MTFLAVLGSAAPADAATQAGQLVISEFRLHGPAGLNDEYIEVLNTAGSAHTVASEIPRGLDLDRCSTVLVWCRAFSVGFGAAPLRRS